MNFAAFYRRPSAPALFALFSLGMCMAQISEAQKYTVTRLLTAPGDNSASGASMNNAGVVVGSVINANGNSLAVKWTLGKPTTIYDVSSEGLPSEGAEAVAINNQGIVIGDAYDFFPTVFEVGTNVSTAQSFDHGIGVEAISDSNVIVGTLGGHPAIWDGIDVSQSPAFLPTTDGNFGVYSQPSGINAAGVIAGIEYDYLPDFSDTFAVAVRWQPDPTTHSPGATVKALTGLGGVSSGANAINENGWIVGWAAIGNGYQHATLWEPTTDGYDLGTLGGKQSAANAVNAEGDIAGEAQTSFGAWHAVVWTHKHFSATDLNLEISPALAKRFTLISASATNDRCMVLANGVDNSTGGQEAFVLQLADQAQCSER